MQAQVDQAGVAVKQAELALKNSELVAPIAAVVGTVNIRANEFPPPGLPAIVLSDDAGYEIELNVDEIDIAQLGVGQPVLITIDALEDAELTGEVSRIAPLAESGASGRTGGIVTYLVTIAIDESDAPLRAGLTAAVTITTDEARDVVVLPNRVMRIDRQTGQPYVFKIVDGIPQLVDVEIGLRNEQFSEVLSGVEAGRRDWRSSRPIPAMLCASSSSEGRRMTTQPPPNRSRRRHQSLSDGRDARCTPCAACRCKSMPGEIDVDHGAVRLRQIHPDEHPRRARCAHRRPI